MKIDAKLINQIIDKKRRYSSDQSDSFTSDRYLRFEKSTNALWAALSEIVNGITSKPDDLIPHNEFFKYIPIALVAMLESYVRTAIANLIDNGPPFSENVKKLKDVQFRIESVLAIHSKKVTIGEVISHILPINNVDNIISNFSIIMNNEFDNKLKGTINMLSKKNDANFVLKILASIFVTRHIYCHEPNPSVKPKLRLSLEAIRCCEIFVTSIENCISKVIGNKTP